MSTSDLKLKLRDPLNKTRLDTVPVSELFSYLKLYEQAVLACTHQAGDDKPVVCLVGLSESSVLTTLRHSPACVSAALAIKVALLSADFTQLPIKCHEKLVEFSRVLTSRGVTATIDDGQGKPAEISPERPVLPRKVVTLQNKTTVYGRCERVGGETPKAAIRLFASGVQLDVMLTTELAIELAKRLYDFVGIEGTAVVDVATGEAVSFNAERISPYAGKKADPTGALKRLREKIGSGNYGDPVKYVAEMRGEEQ